MELKKDYEELSIKELRQIKDKIEKILKEKNEEEKNLIKSQTKDNANYAKENIKTGDKVIFKYKDETIEGIVQKLNEKTFTVAFNFNGEDKILARSYHLFIKKIIEKVA